MDYTEIEDGAAVATIKVVGVGGAGCNAINNMIDSALQGVSFIAANTDLQTLNRSKAEHKVQLGERLTRGLGAGASPDVGRESAIESIEAIKRELGQCEMVFITAGMGGGTGTGAAPVVAQAAKDMGALTVGVVTKPFYFEGKKRLTQAEQGLAELKKHVDSIITIPNDRLISLACSKASFVDMFKRADEVLYYAVRGISDIIMVPGLINRDFADVRTIMQGKGLAMMGTGIGSGENRAKEAAIKAITSPLLEDVSIDGAMGVLINVTCGMDARLDEVNEACATITEAAHPDATILFGAVLDHSLEDEMQITVIATGIEGSMVKDVRNVGLHGLNVISGGAQPAGRIQPLRQSQQPFGSQGVDRNIPAYMRNGGADPARSMSQNINPLNRRASRAHEPGKEELLYDENEMEIPTFIRRQAD